MATRNEENFKVNHANTGRLMKSSIPYMQRILNLERNVEKKEKYHIKTMLIEKGESLVNQSHHLTCIIFCFVPVNFCLCILL